MYTVNDTGGCSGNGELARVVEGSGLALLDLPETSGRPTEAGSVVLAGGVESGAGCRFNLGIPLDRPATGYQNVDLVPESEPATSYSVSLEGRRVTVNLYHSET